MTRRKQGLGLLSLLAVVALGAMAFAAGAQAASPGFLVNKSKTALEASVGGTQEGVGTLLVPSSNLEVNCTGFSVKQGLILTLVDADATLLYEGCTALEMPAPIGKLEEITTCHVSDVAGGDKTKLHVTASALLLPIEFKDGTFGVLAEKIVATINFLPELGCPLPLKNVVTGEVCFKVSAGNDTTEPLIQSSQAIQEACPEIKLELNPEKPVTKDKLLFGAKESFIDGSATLKLSDEAHKGQTLGVSLI
jgi:hypothetical protein